MTTDEQREGGSSTRGGATHSTAGGQFADELPYYLTERNRSCNRTANKSRECFCRVCDLRVTHSTDRDREYGHDPHCEHSMRNLDRNSTGGAEA